MSKPYWIIRLIVTAVFVAVGLTACGGGPETADVTLGSSANEMVNTQTQGCESACYGSLTPGYFR